MIKKIVAGIFIIVILCFLGYEFSDHDTKEADEQNKLIVYCSSPNYFSTPLIQEFEKNTGIKVDLVQQGAGSLLQRLEKESEAPIADVLWTGSLNIVKEKTELFENYQSINEVFVKSEFKNKEGCLTRFTEIPNIIIVNTKLIDKIPVNGYEDLLNPALNGKIAFADPAESSSAYEHLINMLYVMGNGNPEDGWPYVQQFCQNLGGKILRTSDAVYQGVAAGEFVVGCTFEQKAINYHGDTPVKTVYMQEGVVSQTDGLYIIKKCRNQVNAQRFVDFMTSKNTQTFIAQKFYRRSVRTDVELAQEMLPKQQMKVIKPNAEQISRMRTTWLDRFHTVFIHTL